MKTTVEISDVLFTRARDAAKRRGTSLRALIELGLTKVLAQQETHAPRPKMRDYSFGGSSKALSDLDPQALRSERSFVVVDGVLIKQ